MRVKRTKLEIEEDILTQTKVCCVCNLRKPFEDFYNFRNKSDGKSYRCKPCDGIARDAYRIKHSIRVKIKERNQNLVSKYGITQEDYLEMLAKQDNSCAICKCHVSENRVGSFVDSLSVDHCHKTGKVRGLLCNQCNRALGMFKDSVELLIKAKEYLIKNGESLCLKKAIK